MRSSREFVQGGSSTYDGSSDIDELSEPPGSVLDVLAQDMTALLVPVTICMAFVVFLVLYLPPTPVVEDLSIDVGTLYYHEQVGGGNRTSASFLNFRHQRATHGRLVLFT